MTKVGHACFGVYNIKHQTFLVQFTLWETPKMPTDLFVEVMRNFFPQAEHMLQIGYWFVTVSVGVSVGTSPHNLDQISSRHVKVGKKKHHTS